jgi:hypothetical protein
MKLVCRLHAFFPRSGIIAALAAGVALAGSARADLVYWQNFDSGTGTPTISPGGGVLAVSAPAIFSTTGGILGGSMDASGNPNNSTSGTGGAGTSYAGGSPISGLPNQNGGGAGSMDKFTITLWFNPSSIRASAAYTSVHHRLIILGDSAMNDFSVGSATLAILQRNASGPAPDHPKAIDIYAKGVSASGANTLTAQTTGGFTGTEAAEGTWWFVALTYDGTSSFGNNSLLQQTATGGVSMVNGQLYFGSSSSAVTRFDAPLTDTGGDAMAASAGAFNFGNSAKLLMANNGNPNRSWDGFMDDFRIYDTVLSAAEVEEVRMSALPVPGDFNGDQEVDGEDFSIWQMNFPTASEALLGDGDADGDGDVDGADFVVWQTNFSTPALGVTPVPEPSAAILATLATLWMVVSAQRRPPLSC